MPENRRRNVRYSRRDFARLALVSLPSVSLLQGAESALAQQPKPNSVWGGVPFGIFAPYRFGPEASDLEGALKALVTFGVSQTELSNAVVERHLGAPQPAAGRGGGGGGGGRGTQTPEQQAAARAAGRAADRRGARRCRSSKFAEVRKKFDDAGVTIYAFRLTLTRGHARRGVRLHLQRRQGARRHADHDGAARGSRRLQAHRRLRRPSTRSTSATTCTRPRRSPPGTRPWRSRRATACSSTSATTSRARASARCRSIEKHHARIFSMHLKDRKRVVPRQLGEHAVGPGRHADQGRAAGAEEEPVGDSGRHRVRVSGSGRLDVGCRNREVRQVRERRARG